MTDERDWEQVERYTQKRREDDGDIFGWLRSEDGDAVAVLLAAESSRIESFPREIAGIRIVVQKITTPEKQA